jgi:hypothetical protein
MPISRDSSQDQLTENDIVTITLTEIPSSTRKFSRSANAMTSLNNGLNSGDLNGIQINDQRIAADRLNNNIEDEEDSGTKRRKKRWLAMNSAVDCLMDCYSFTCDICLSYYKWVLFILYNIYWIIGIQRTWHKVSPYVAVWRLMFNVYLND